MNFSVLQEKCFSFFREHAPACIIGVLGFVFLVYGFVSFYYTNVPEDEISFSSKEVKPSAEGKGLEDNSKKKMIMVDVSGAVNKPGVYTLASDSRVQDAILEAGGLAANVDQQKVAQTLNLAAPLTDGTKLYIPVIGEQMVTSGNTSGSSSGTSNAVAGASTSLININTADQAMLESLPGVGEVTAGKITDNRPYGSVEELRTKEVLGEATFEKVRDLVSVY